MSIAFDPTGDFVEAVDGATAVCLFRTSGEEASIAAALPRPVEDSAAAPPFGLYTGIWELPLAGGVDAPDPGDRIIDGDTSWVIVEVRRPRFSGLVRCKCVSDYLHAKLSERVDIEEAVWDGSTVVSWNTVRAATPAHFSLVQTTSDHTTTPSTSASRYLVYLADAMPLTDRHRLRSAVRGLFRVEAYRPSDARGSLPEVDATLVPAASP